MESNTSQSSVGDGSSSAPFVLGVLAHNRNPDIWCNWDLVEMSDRTTKARCKFCSTLLSTTSNSTLNKHITRKFCKALKDTVDVDQPGITTDGTIFRYNHMLVRDRMAKLVIQ